MLIGSDVQLMCSDLIASTYYRTFGCGVLKGRDSLVVTARLPCSDDRLVTGLMIDSFLGVRAHVITILAIKF